jgi:peptidase C25-like protein
MSTLLLMLLIGAPGSQGVDTLVVCPQEFRQALAPWLKYREGQGHRLAVISNMKSPAELRAEVRRVAAAGRLRYLLLVGDADPAMSRRPELRKRCVPTHHAPAVVNVRFGSESEIATDNWYADVDDDRLPDLAVGRLTSDSAAELSRMVERILAYETSTDFGLWRRQVHFVAGLGGFGPVTDAVFEAAAKTLITAGVPAAYRTTMTYGSWQSPYCPDPRQFQRVTMERLNEGSLFWVYIGHGEQRSVDQMHVPGGAFPILSSPDAARLSCRHGAPIACFLACYSGAFDQPRDCLAEEMLRSPGGPVAIICGSRVTMPYAMAVMGSELLHEFFGRRPATIGEAIVAAKRRTMQDPAVPEQRAALDAVGKVFSPSGDDLQAERAEHLDLFNLLGDPLLRLPYPREATIDVGPTATAGGHIRVEGRSPVDGAGTVELVVRRDRLTFQPPRREQFDYQSLAGYAEVYERANEPRLASAAVELVEGRFVTQLDVPSGARGACHVRVFVEGSTGCATGAADVRVDGPASSIIRP